MGKESTYVCVCVRVSLAVLSDSGTPRTVACQAPLSMEFSRQEYWSGLPFPCPGDLPKLQIDVSCIAGRYFTIGDTRETQGVYV